jgi:hypothetical protein
MLLVLMRDAVVELSRSNTNGRRHVGESETN